MTRFTTIVMSSACALALAACQTAGPRQAAPTQQQNKIEITGGTFSPPETPMVPTDPNVQVYDTEGPLENPLAEDRTHSVLDNTTAGGYTVFDPSVKVYPLPGEDVPAYMPSYAVKPYEGAPEPAPRMGQPMGLAATATLPPVPTVDVQQANPYANPPVPGAIYKEAAPASAQRQPMTLTAPDKTGMQPPSQARSDMPSPFMKGTPRAPSLTGADPMPMDGGSLTAAEPVQETAPTPEAAPAQSQGLQAGRRSSPLLTGY